MSRILKVDEFVTIWRRTEYEVSDTISDKEFLHKIYEIGEENVYSLEGEPGIKFISSDFVYETEEHCKNSYVEVYNKDYDLIGRV